jgi:hypothetical protein
VGGSSLVEKMESWWASVEPGSAVQTAVNQIEFWLGPCCDQGGWAERDAPD